MRIFLNFVLLITILTLLHAEEDISRKKKKKKQECKKPKDTCSENEECCSKSCYDTLKNKICLGRQRGEDCTNTNQCTDGKCEAGKCECVEVQGKCQSNENCCFFKAEQTVCEDGECVKMAGEKCEEDDDCFSGNCKENQVTEEKECEPHNIGEVCNENDQCLSMRCSNKKCDCFESGHDCEGVGKFCCNKDEECKPLVSGGVPACGKCKQIGQKCKEGKECCTNNCFSGAFCDCVRKFAACESNNACCNHAMCKIWKEGDKKKTCNYKTQENGAECKVNDQCKSNNCEDGKCQCIKAGHPCTVNGNCCSNICHVTDTANHKQSCYGI